METYTRALWSQPQPRWLSSLPVSQSYPCDGSLPAYHPQPPQATPVPRPAGSLMSLDDARTWHDDDPKPWHDLSQFVQTFDSLPGFTPSRPWLGQHPAPACRQQPTAFHLMPQCQVARCPQPTRRALFNPKDLPRMALAQRQMEEIFGVISQCSAEDSVINLARCQDSTMQAVDLAPEDSLLHARPKRPASPRKQPQTKRRRVCNYDAMPLMSSTPQKEVTPPQVNLPSPVHCKAPLVCDTCGKKFTHRSSLFNHRRSHDKVKAFSCTLCEATFAYKSSYTKHMRTHTKERPFLCKVCSQTFTQSGNLLRHSRRAHPTEVDN